MKLPLRAPFRISDHVFHEVETVVVRLEADGHAGQGEAAGVFYLGDEPAEMLRTLAEARGWIEQGLDHAAITDRLPPGGARNALDCALWDLQARRAGRRSGASSAWNRRARCSRPSPSARPHPPRWPPGHWPMPTRARSRSSWVAMARMKIASGRCARPGATSGWASTPIAA
ncbi:hypothetical protein ACFSTI_16830 [Rhizorhabdus histidinilytica]